MGNMFQGSGAYTYIVAQYGYYRTIQSAIDAIVANSDAPDTVYITPGTYTEDLTLYDNINLKGADNDDVFIDGKHTPPTSGSVFFSNIWFYSSTSILEDTVNAGSTEIQFRQCGFNLTNGYIFNLNNWTGALSLINCKNDLSAVNGIISNAGTSYLSILESTVGAGSTTAAIVGTTRIKNSRISCPLTFSSTATVSIIHSKIRNKITVSDDAELTISLSTLVSNASDAVLDTTSSKTVYLENVVVDTDVAGSALDGSGTIEAAEVTFIDTDQIAGTLTVTYAANLKASNLTTHGIVALPDTIASGLAGVITFDGDNFVHKMGTRNAFVGRECGSTGLTVADATDNSGFGNEALHNLTAGEHNAAVGSYALNDVTTGSYNSTLGSSSLPVVSGSYNVAIGYQAGTNCTTSESSNILIGNAGTALEDNCIRIGTDGSGNGQQSDNYQAGIYQTTMGAASPNREVVWIDNNHKLFSTNSGMVLWTVATGSLTMAGNTGYIVQHSTPATLTVLTLPATSSVGDVIEITGYTSGMFQIAQNAGQQIFFGNQSTTLGAGGSIDATHQYDSIKLVCCTADTEWKVLSSVGVFNVV